MSTATIYRDSKIYSAATLTADQGKQYTLLAAAVRDTQSILRNHPEFDADGVAIKSGTSRSGVAGSESHPDDIYTALARIDEILGGHDSRMPETFPHLKGSFTTEKTDSHRPKWGNTVPQPATVAALRAIQPDGDYIALAVTLNMVPGDGLKFDRAELTDTGPAAVIESGGASVGGSSVPQLRAFVRWRA